MASPPVVQVLAKDDFSQQSLVSLPDLSLAPLPPSAVRVRTEVCALTVNNLTYAKLGHLFGWWDVYPLPAAGVPEPFNDSSKYGTVCVWGFARVLESTVDNLPMDSLIFGYLPIGTLPVDLVIEPLVARGHVAEVSPRRSHLLPIYNRYITFRHPAETAGLSRDILGWGALTRPLFLLPWALNKFVFAWDQECLVSPSAASREGLWSFENAHLTDAIVVVLSGSGKTALCFAQQLRRERPEQSQPAKIVGVTSDATSKFAESTHLYDKVLTYDKPEEEEGRLGEALGIGSSSGTKIVLCDFGSRGRAFQTWVTTLKPLCQEIVALGIGGDPKVVPPDVLKQTAAEHAALGAFRANASDVVDGAMGIMGEESYWREFMASWRKLVVSGTGIPGVSLQWGTGMTDLSRVWDSLCTDKVHPQKGYVFEL